VRKSLKAHKAFWIIFVPVRICMRRRYLLEPALLKSFALGPWGVMLFFSVVQTQL